MSYLRPRFLVVMMLGLLFTELAWAHDPHWKTVSSMPSGIQSVTSGPNAWQYGYPSPRIYTYPPVMTVPVIPKAYLEQNAREMQQNNWHFYCRSSQAYFPHAQDCPSGWEVVSLYPELR
jgi:hypothetical protein